MTYILERRVLIPAPRDTVFAFFEDPGNLAKITPRWTGFKDLTPEGPPLRVGLRTAHTIRWLGVGLRWTSKVVEYEPPHRFVDEQIGGPFRAWRHEHVFEDANGGTIMRDRVQYELPFGILGDVTHRLIVKGQLRRIFDYRERRIKQLFASDRPAPAVTTEAEP